MWPLGEPSFPYFTLGHLVGSFVQRWCEIQWEVLLPNIFSIFFEYTIATQLASFWYPRYFQYFENRIYIKWWSAIPYCSSKPFNILFAPKKMKINVFKNLSWMANFDHSIFHYPSKSFLSFFFFFKTWSIQLFIYWNSTELEFRLVLVQAGPFFKLGLFWSNVN